LLPTYVKMAKWTPEQLKILDILVKMAELSKAGSAFIIFSCMILPGVRNMATQCSLLSVLHA
jgi:hypothetical protein